MKPFNIGQNKQSNLIASVKKLNTGDINKYTMKLGIGEGELFSIY